jgi:hypothetical protein
MSIANTARLLAGTLGLAICAFGQIVNPFPPGASVTTTRTSNLPPIGIAGTETAQVILTNTAANPASSVMGTASSTTTAASCTGSVSFYNASGAPIGTATAFTLTSGQIEQVSLPYATPGILAGTSAGRAPIRAVVTQTTRLPSPAPCSLSYSLVIFDTTTGATHAIVTDSGLTGIAATLAIL